jgi:hypothetical protein
MAVYGGGSLWFPYLLAPNRYHSTINQGLGLSSNTHTPFEASTYWSGIQSCYPVHIHARLLTPCLPLGKYK